MTTIASAEVVGRITDDLILPAYRDGQWTAAGLWAAIAAVMIVSVLRAVGIGFRRYGAYRMKYRLEADARRAVTRQYVDLPIRWHRTRTTGELLSVANADIEASFQVAAPLPLAVSAVVMVVITTVLLFLADPILAVLGLLIGPVLGVANYAYQKAVKDIAMEAQERRGDVSRIAHESFDAALVVKTLGRELQETERFRRESEELRDRMIKIGRVRAKFDPVIEALPNIATLLVLVVGARRVEAGILRPGELVEFAYLLRLVALPVRVFGWLFGDLPRSIAGWNRVDAVLRSTGAMRYGTTPTDHEGAAATAARTVTFHHPAPDGSRDDDSARGVEGLDFDISPGRVVAIVGPTGSGKSTIAALLVRLFDPDNGALEIDGLDLRDVSRASLAEDVAVVFQDAFLFDDTVRHNIDLGAGVSDDALLRAARLARADEFVSALEGGYDAKVGERGATLSGGQRQRIALARALLRSPRLLVLDDATSAVDPAVEQEILRGLKASGIPTTTMLIAARQSSIALADEVLYVEHGRVAARGAHLDLMASNVRYRDLVTAYERDHDERAEQRADAGSVS